MAPGNGVGGAVGKRRTDSRVHVGALILVKPGQEMGGLEAIAAALERALRARPTPWFEFFDVWALPVAAS